MPLIEIKIKFLLSYFYRSFPSTIIILLLINLNLLAQRDTSTIIYVGDKGYPPYEYLDKDDEPTGFNVDLIKAIGKELNKKVQVNLMNWTEARNKLEDGSADVLSMFYLPERMDVVDFGESFIIINHEIFIRKNSSPINNLDEISGKSVIVQRGAFASDYLATIPHSTNIVLVDDEPSALVMLASGKYDCAIVGQQVGRYIVRTLNLDNITTSGPPFLPCEYRITVKKGNTELLKQLSKALAAIKINGSYDKVYNKWLAAKSDTGVFDFLSEYLEYILGLLLIITLVALILTVHYKNKMLHSSIEIQNELEKRKQIEIELRASQQMLSKAQQIAQIGNWELDLITNKHTWSEQIFELFGIDHKSFTSHFDDLFKSIHPNDRQKRIAAHSDALTSKKPLEVEYRIIRPDGELRHILTKGEFSFDENHQPLKMFGTAQDITERKILENSLKDSEERYKLLFRNNPLPMWVYSTSSLRFLAVNQTAERKYGYTREEFLKMTIKDIQFDEDTKQIKEYLDSVNDDREVRHRKKDGTIINVEVISHSISFGEEQARLILANDITEKLNAERLLRENENRLSVIYNSTSDLMYMFSVEQGPKFKLQTVNKAFIKTFEGGIGNYINHYVDDIPRLNTTSIKNRMLKVLDTKTQISFEEKIIIDSNQLTFENTLSPIIEDSGNCVFIIGSSRNISERIKAQEELKISKNQLRDLAANLQNIREEERTAIAREIHDELGQVLTYLKINLTLLEKNFSSTNTEIGKVDFHNDIQGMIDIIDKAVKRIRKLITELRPEVLDNLGLIPALEWQIQEFIDKTGMRCTFKKNIDEIEIDKHISTAVFRIFQEALTNIVKHAHASAVEVSLYFEDTKLSLEISDNGIGLDETETQRKKTFGILGMRERAIILGGSFIVDSKKDIGTKLLIDIPLSEYQKQINY